MCKRIKRKGMFRMLRKRASEIPEHRTGENEQYNLVDAVLSGFSVFYMQCPSFLSWQQDMEKSKGRSNAQSLFGIESIPCVEQIRNLLDPVKPSYLGPVFWDVYSSLSSGGQLNEITGVGGTRLISLDGTQHHSSKTICCPNCRVTVHNEQATYSHNVLLAMLCSPEHSEVLSLEPEYLTLQDGHDKQDSEQAAIKRWVEKHSSRFTPWSSTLLADDLHCHQPICELCIQHKMYFIFTCKRDSHTTLYEELDLLKKVEGAIGEKKERRWNGRHYELWHYRWAESLPLRREKPLLVNWCEVTIYHAKTGEQLYYNAWATNHVVNQETVHEVVVSGRCRWKVENEGINVLKNHGYNFEHNYGHGEQHLANTLLSLLLIAFLFHTVLQLNSILYQAVRQAVGSRRKFFNDIQALTRYILFSSWHQLLLLMAQGMDIDITQDMLEDTG